MMAENEPRTIGYLRVSRESQDPEKNRADILTLANREDPKERNPETQGMKSYGGIGTYVRLGPKSDTPAASRRRGAVIGLEDALALADMVPTVSEAAPQIETLGSFAYGGRSVGRGLKHGVSGAFARVNRLRVAEGRFLSDMDAERYFSVVGADVASAMRRGGAREVVGDVLEIDERLFTVVGVLADTPETYGLAFELHANQSVFVPITTVRRIDPRTEIGLIVARVEAGAHHADAARDVQAYFSGRTRGLALEVTSAKQLIGADGVSARTDDSSFGRGRLHQPYRRWHRGDEHHADFGGRAAPRDWHSPSTRRDAREHPGPVLD